MRMLVEKISKTAIIVGEIKENNLPLSTDQ